MLKAVFYARFHPDRGPSIIHQYPRDSIIGSHSSQKNTLLNFSNISSYIIPPYELCNRPISVGTNDYRVLGFPLSLEDAKYDRNRFTFNVCFVLPENSNNSMWDRVVSKTAEFFKAIEEEDGLLQAEERQPKLKWAGENGYPAHDVGIVFNLLETILEDLNAYDETCVRIDDLHVLNLAIPLSKAAPKKARAWDVPLLIRSLPTQDEWTWDLVLHRIHPHIDGVNHVQRIAELADVEIKLAKKAVRELLYHDRAIVLDIFHFQAIYNLTTDFSWFVKDDAMQNECAKYVFWDHHLRSTSPTADSTANMQVQSHSARELLVRLYRGFHSGICVRDFYLNHESQLAEIDIRRFITYGVIKGFLRRIHKYALFIESHQKHSRLSVSNNSVSRSRPIEDVERDWDRAWKKAAFSSGWATPPTEPPPESIAISAQSSKSFEIDTNQEERLRGYLDGNHCMDEICVALRTSEKKVVDRLRSGRFGEVLFFYR